MQDNQLVQKDEEGRAFIEQIRRSEYMIGMTLAPDAEAAAEGMRRKLSSALRLLSDDLYSTKTHFVLELIQNADDNAYEIGVAPEIQIGISPSTLRIWNNEQGFTHENVRALCSVGESTKSKKVGFIGEKGIGFKSVFQVSDTPEIHSNGFHFRFNMSNPEEHLGYVVPHWIEPEESISGRGTTIILPAKARESFTHAVLSELDARLLLFLRKLRRIELRTPGEEVSMQRLDAAGFAVLQTDRHIHGSEATRTRQSYLHVSTSVSMVATPDDKRPEALDSEMILAFPVDEAGKALATPDCATFAFLPIRTFGFRFCVQADFLLSSAREDIQTARPWNVALRDAIAPAFVASLEQFRNRPALARTFLRFLPQEQELAHSFFAPVVQQTVAALAQTECILCTTGQWRRPANVMTASAQFQRLVPAEQAWELFGKDYPARDLDVEPDTLKELGCAPLYFADIVSLFTRHGDWVRNQGRAWLVQFFRYLATFNRQHLRDAGICEAACLPVSDGSLQSPSDGTVFFPLARGLKFGFEEELRILDEEFINAIEEKDETEIYGLLRDLGVCTPEPYTLITNHILPAHQSNRWLESDFSALTGHVRYVRAKLGDYLAAAARHGITEAPAIEALSKGLRLKTKNNESQSWYFKRAGDLYLGHEYQPEFDIDTLLGASLDPLRLTSPDYLPPRLAELAQPERAAVLADWRAFFFRIGVNPSPCLTGEVNAACSPELSTLLTSENSSTRQKTLECLNRHWNHYSRQATYVPYGRSASARSYTQFALALRATIAPTKQRRTAALQDTYYPSEIVRDVFGSSPTYIDAELENEEFLDTCGIVHRVDANACIKRLKQIKVDGRASAAAVRPLYRHLDQIFDRFPSVVRDAFHEHALILTRSTETPWRLPDEVVWSLPGEFLNIHYPALNSQYADSHSFFVRKLGVPQEVSVAAAVRTLPSLAASGLTTDAQASEALRIYVRANRELASPHASATPAWLINFKTRSVYLNHRGEMVAQDGTLYADDHPATSALFAEQADISFLAVPPARLPQIKVLLEAAEVPLLSESVSISLQEPGAGSQNNTITTRIRERYCYIARLVYAQSHTVFEQAKEAGLWRRLSALSVIDVEALTICTTLQDITATTQGEVLISGETAFVRVGSKGVADRLAREICIMLKAPMMLVDGISRILRDEDAVEVEEYFDVRVIPALPDDEILQLTLEHLPPEHDMSSVSDSAQDENEVVPVQSVVPLPQGPSPTLALVGNADTPPQSATSPTPQPLPDSGAAMTATKVRHTSPAGSGSAVFDNRIQPAAASVQMQDSPIAHLESGSPANHGITVSGAVAPGGTRRSGSRRRRKQVPDHRDTGHRLLSYVELAPTDITQAPSPDPAARPNNRDITAQAAVQYFLQTQQAKWASLEEMPPYNKGFDIRAIAHDGSEHLIEIKGQSAAWTAAGIAMTPSELLCAADKREHYWLCIVEHATQPGRQILHTVNDPFGRADQFRFDSGWKAAATLEASVSSLAPAPGLHIEMQDIGSGIILSVKKTGSMFYKIHVHLTDGRQVFKVFDPARMRLSHGV